MGVNTKELLLHLPKLLDNVVPCCRTTCVAEVADLGDIPWWIGLPTTGSDLQCHVFRK